ncbi:energy-coupling factor transport system ATP-binding protein [Breznakia sp. PF5-3]|uniref:energy-coupling factor transporter ATPase n=1 Tax=unclassified Breznakia TaxID=2623764 RepID=UPI002404D0DC|nr:MULTISPECIES: energy-coupling factor transporter ATPase [unclassified Breznakia]MDL2276309.1 energy-coupling factor transporter ATPase [Breznakia sp. OttesenSCG-928-G09]MDF9825138.1 energy-coupling factor transport system ATP-binding protein [Breznakia sp. PM6-1]MDF9836003.1 energy-coupling factor transport system ATP-binding protein [Breznakia sp. PF5-3]MDF9838101.1 energy-coupling factor transport system ATP-binding protein [Breznakia sp. PFB2-8]MDF9860069.1 energy-coupling factor transpo
MEIIKVKNLNFSYDETTPTIKDVSFSVEEGSYTTIVGHNGSGKSTIAKLLDGLLEKKSGSIEIGGLELNEANIYKIREQVGIVFQNPDNQFIGATVADDIAFGLENQQVPSDEMPKIIEQYAKKVNMYDFLDKEPTKLSGGQKQRVAIAGVLAMNLKVIILDEATSMLDPQGKVEINALVNELHEKSNLTIISITHDMEEVLRSDHVLVMDNGEVKISGTPEEVLSNEKELIDLKLDLPFVYKMQKELYNVGFEFEKQLELEGVVESLCQLNLKR